MTIFDKATGFVKSYDDVSVYYEVRGQGEPIIMVYGIACLINHWHHQIRYFSQNYQTVAFDLRGHHMSTSPTDKTHLSLDAIANDVRALMKELKIQKAHFFGHSFGAQVILKIYEESPELVESIVFINGFAKNPVKGMFGLDVVEKFFLFAKSQYNQTPDLWNALWKWAVTHPVSVPLSALAGGFNLNMTSLKDIQIYARGVAAMDLPVFMTLFEALMEYNAEHVLPMIKVPTLIISGLKDGVTPQKYQQHMHRMIRGSEFMTVPYGSHCTQLDFPDYVNLRIEKFLKDLED